LGLRIDDDGGGDNRGKSGTETTQRWSGAMDEPRLKGVRSERESRLQMPSPVYGNGNVMRWDEEMLEEREWKRAGRRGSGEIGLYDGEGFLRGVGERGVLDESL